MLNIKLESEYIFSLFGFNITNTFFTSFLVVLIILLFSFYFYKNRNKNNKFIIHLTKKIIIKLYDFTDNTIHNKKFSLKILPVVTTFFIFILTANLLALLPGFLNSIFIENSEEKISLLKSPNSDLTTTIALSLISVFFVQFFSVKMLGFKGFLKRFINFSSPTKFVLGFFEIISESVKVLSFSFRLFGNVFAGEVLLLIIAFLTPYIIPLPFMILEIFVGFIQAFIFAVLTLTFIKVGMLKHDK